MVLKAQVADSIIRMQKKEIDLLSWALQDADSAAAAARRATDYSIQAGKALEDQLSIKDQQLRQEKTRRKKWMVGALFGVAVIIGQFVFGG